MQDPIISIVIPTFNSASTLSGCLESIVNQTIQNIEVLIIDGLSTDNTLGIVKRFAVKYNYIKIVSEKDQGIYDAMNKGIRIAKGEWIYFLGSDDKLYNENVLMSLVNYFNDNELDIIYGNVIFQISGKKYDNKFNSYKLLERNICHQAIFVRKEIFNVLGLFETDYIGLADWHFNMKWFNDKSIKHHYTELTIAYYYEDGFCFNNPDIKFYQDWDFNTAKYFPWILMLFYKHRDIKMVRKLLTKFWDE